MITSTKRTCSNWLCSTNSSSKNMFVKIVYPGGRIELHDRPIPAAEIMLQNPNCYVAHLEVFRQPWTTVLEPDTMLLLGQKFYVVPISTVRKLQRCSSIYYRARLIDSREESDEESSTGNNENDGNGINSRSDFLRRNKLLCDVKCLLFCVRIRMRGSGGGGGLREEKRSLNNTTTTTNTNTITSTRKRTFISSCSGNEMRGSYKRFASRDPNWQPSLESISEE